MSEWDQPISVDSNVEEVLRMFPATVAVFLRWRMHCVGCPIARFESVSGACRAYRQPVDRFLEELNRAAMSQQAPEFPNETHFI